MFRRIVTLSLVPLLLLPGLCFAHSHAGSGIQEPADHDSQPHFHLRALLGVLLGPCSSAPFRCHADSGTVALHPEGPVTDHDADAIYVSAVLGQLSEQCRAVPEGAPTLMAVPQLAACRAALDQPLPHPAFLSPPPCPIYLQTLALLI